MLVYSLKQHWSIKLPVECAEKDHKRFEKLSGKKCLHHCLLKETETIQLQGLLNPVLCFYGNHEPFLYGPFVCCQYVNTSLKNGKQVETSDS